MWLILIVSVLAEVPYGGDAPAVDAYVQRLQARDLSYVERVVEIAKDGLGTTYSDSPLGEGPDGKYDTD
ncbi:MAG: hypothetical protein L3K26_15105, partial [Candidatus Hydrogenedentes bacterium]|nr:hypothetical protein [Candidatus Hydrogenedentota bacterium]